MKKVAVLGDGAFGTAIAQVLADCGLHVNLWCHNADVATMIAQHGENQRYLPGVPLHKAIVPTTDIAVALQEVKWVFEAVPVPFLRSVIEQTKECDGDQKTWVVLSKGVEQETIMLPSQILEDVLGDDITRIVLVGPSFAKELARKQQTAFVAACDEQKPLDQLQKMLTANYLLLSMTDDMIGVQIGSALKNIIALGVGMLDGAGYGENVKALLLTQGLHEMAALMNNIGAEQETIFGLSGLGDLVLTSCSTSSRNMSVGKRLGAGHTLDEIVVEIGTAPEGINTLQALHQLLQETELTLPLCEGIYQAIFNGGSIHQVVQQMFARE